MEVTLSGGVRPKPDDRVYAAGPDGLAPGAPVAVGPPSSGTPTAVLAQLRALVAAGGPVAADAGADLGKGFRSARVDGGTGDRRDAVLAALAVSGFADRLGPPAALLVALFGPEATRPLGAATLDAIAAGRWAVLRYAVAASDLLGPEQLVTLLGLRAPEGVDPFPSGLPSVVGSHLGRVLGPLSRPRRLRMLTDLWEQVCAAGSARLRRERLRAGQVRERRYQELSARFRRHEDDEVLTQLQRRFGPEPTLAEAALWEAPMQLWVVRANRTLNDALAATVLARLAVSAVDLGIPAAVDRHRTEITVAARTITRREAATASRLVSPSPTGHPARPACYLRQIDDILRRDGSLTPKRQVYVQHRLALAYDYADLALDHARDFMLRAGDHLETATAREAREAWAAGSMSPWRDQVGYFSPRAAGPETAGDYFWYTELADAIAQLRGDTAAVITVDEFGPYAELDPVPDRTLMPRPDAIALAASGTAQLAELGGTVPARARTWPELVTGLLAGVLLAESRTSRFTVPAAADQADGTLLPGTEARIEIARTGRHLADWASYMGNCISGEHYAKAAAAGKDVLLALRAPDGRILANAEVRLSGKGWRLAEIRARFNEDPDEELVRRTKEWVGSLPPAVTEPETATDPEPVRARGHRPTPAARLTAAVGERLGELADAAVRPDPVLFELIGAAPSPEALVALRRASPATLTRGCRRLLDDNRLAALWEASSHRPLTEAVAGMPATVHDRLTPLLSDEPIPRALRRLARLPRIAPARDAQLVTIRVRAALGVLLREDAPSLARAITARPHGAFLRAGALSVTSWGGAGAVTAVTVRRRIRVPGYPASSLRDERWQSAWPDAVELGADQENFWSHIAEHGLLVPTSWLTAGWPALWARANR